MAEYQITYWRDIPSMVVARDDNGTVKVQLAARFQEAIDEAAMRAGAADADAYLAGWVRGEWTSHDGVAVDVAEEIGRRIEDDYDEQRLNALMDGE